MALKFTAGTIRFPDGASAFEFPGIETDHRQPIWISGPNGAGKSTLLRHFANTDGAISENGSDQRASLVDQNYQDLIYPYRPVWWNAALPKVIGGEAEEDVRAVARRELERFGLDLDLCSFPSVLSGGEAHLVLIVRAVLSKNEALLLDEPLAGLDPDRRRQLWQLIADLADKRIVVVVSHEDPSEVRTSEHIKFPGVAKRPLTVRLMEV